MSFKFARALTYFSVLVCIIATPADCEAAKRRPKAKRESRRFLGFDEGNAGVGLLVGQPMLVRYQHWFNWKRSLFVDAGYDWEKIAIVGASYSFYFYNVDDLWKAKNIWNSMMFYVGGGVFTGLGVDNPDPNNRYQFGVRGYGGAQYLFGHSPWSIKLEVGPKVFLVGRTAAGLQLMAGVMYYFDMGRKKIAPTPEPTEEPIPAADREEEPSLEDEF